MQITREQINKIITMQENVSTSDEVRYFLMFVEAVYYDKKLILRASDGHIAMRNESENDFEHAGKYYFGIDEIIQLKTALKIWPKFPSQFDFTVNDKLQMEIDFKTMKVLSNKESINFPDVDAIYPKDDSKYPVKISFNANLLQLLNKAINTNKLDRNYGLTLMINPDDKFAPIVINKHDDKALLMPLKI